MFGKPEWFRDKRFGWGLVPRAWQGWVYTAVWGVLLAGPFAALMLQAKPLNAGIWLTAMCTALVVDVWQIKRARQKPETVAAKPDSVLYIGDEEAANVSTKNLDLQLRR